MGRALALIYARPTKNLILIGRDRCRLEGIAADCRSRGSNVEVGVIDVGDDQSTYEFIAKMDRQYEVDLLIANAGISTGLTAGAFIEPNETTHAIFETNVFGVINSIEPLLNPTLALNCYVWRRDRPAVALTAKRPQVLLHSCGRGPL